MLPHFSRINLGTLLGIRMKFEIWFKPILSYYYKIVDIWLRSLQFFCSHFYKRNRHTTLWKMSESVWFILGYFVDFSCWTKSSYVTFWFYEPLPWRMLLCAIGPQCFIYLPSDPMITFWLIGQYRHMIQDSWKCYVSYFWALQWFVNGVRYSYF